MIMDSLLQFSALQLLTATAISTNVVSLSSTGRFVGNTEYKAVVVTVDEPLLSAGATTLTVELITSDNEDMSDETVLMATGALPKEALDATKPVAMFELPDVVYKKFIALRYIVDAGPFTSGSVSAGFAADKGIYRTVARGYVI